MTKADLVDEVVRVSSVSKKHAEIIVNTVFTSIVDALQRELNNTNGTITVDVPIEDALHGGPTLNQIGVDWPSRPTG